MQLKETTFYIVDDDKSIRKILSNIIEENSLGEIIGEAENGKEAERDIVNLKPDIVIMDLLLPFQDGIKTIENLRNKYNCNCNFIAISQVNDKDIVSKAYQAGIEFFIHKPLNVIEVVSVISKVKEFNVLKATLNTIQDVMKYYTHKSKTTTPQQSENIEKKIKNIFADLGVLGEIGSRDVITLLGLIWQREIDFTTANLTEIYEKLSEYYETNNKIKVDGKAIEMRIRRMIAKALSNIALRAIEDYGDEYFIKYSNVLFDYKDVKAEMDYLRKKSTLRGKINVKKFIEGLLWLVEEESKILSGI